jgi:formylmethanofuran dehydrogenase subunit E
MTIEVELKEIKSLLSEVNKKLDALLEEKETEILTVHEEEALKEFLEEEPDIYSIKDVKTKVSHN